MFGDGKADSSPTTTAFAVEIAVEGFVGDGVDGPEIPVVSRVRDAGDGMVSSARSCFVIVVFVRSRPGEWRRGSRSGCDGVCAERWKMDRRVF